MEDEDETLEGRLESLEAKMREVETEQAQLARALLGYVRADLATPWVASARALEDVLTRLSVDAARR